MDREAEFDVQRYIKAHIVRGVRQQQHADSIDAFMIPLIERGWEETEAYLRAGELANYAADLVIAELEDRDDIEVRWMSSDVLTIYAETTRGAVQAYNRAVFNAETVALERFDRILNGTDNSRDLDES